MPSIRFPIMFATVLTVLTCRGQLAHAVDTDGDSIADEDDFCDGDSGVAQMGTAGKASILFFYMGDSPLATFFQNIGTDLSKAMDGYDYTILLKEEDNLGFIELDPAAENGADEVYDPSWTSFNAALRSAVRNGYMVDIWIWAHGGASNGDGSFSATDEDVDGSLVWSNWSPSKTGCLGRQLPIRMVYSVSCYHSLLGETWRNVGAQASVGARTVNFYPNQFGEFAEQFAEGASVDDALAAADTSSSRTLVQTYLLADASVRTALSTDDPLACANPFTTVLGENDCAEWYFNDAFYLAADEDYERYYPSESGQWNANYAAEKQVQGDGTITKASSDFDWRPEIDLAIDSVVLAGEWQPVIQEGRKLASGTVRVYATNNSDVFSSVEPLTVTATYMRMGIVDTTVELEGIDRNDSAFVDIPITLELDASGNPTASAITFTLGGIEHAIDPDISNNELTVSIRPDYTSMVYVRSVDDEAATASVVCFVYNEGLWRASRSSAVALWVDGSRAGLANVSALRPGGYGSGYFSLSFLTVARVALGIELECRADNTNAIAEISETNNRSNQTIGGYLDPDELRERIEFYMASVIEKSLLMRKLTYSVIRDVIEDVIQANDLIRNTWVVLNEMILDYFNGTEFLSLMDDYDAELIDHDLLVEEIRDDYQRHIRSINASSWSY